MSVTFFTPNAPRSLVNACEYFNLDIEYFRDDPFIKWVDGVPMTDESDWPEVNVSNQSFSMIKEFLNLDVDYCGSWKVDDLPSISRKIIRYLASDVSEDTYDTYDTFVDQKVWTESNGNVTEIKRGMKMINIGYDENRIHNMMQNPLNLLQKATTENRSISWG